MTNMMVIDPFMRGIRSNEKFVYWYQPDERGGFVAYELIFEGIHCDVLASSAGKKACRKAIKARMDERESDAAASSHLR